MGTLKTNLTVYCCLLRIGKNLSDVSAQVIIHFRNAPCYYSPGLQWHSTSEIFFLFMHFGGTIKKKPLCSFLIFLYVIQKLHCRSQFLSPKTFNKSSDPFTVNIFVG